MANTITRSMIEQGADQSLWADLPEALAANLFPIDISRNKDEILGGWTDANLAEVLISNNLIRYGRGYEAIPGEIQDDQIEDYIAARAVKKVLNFRKFAENANG